MPPKKRNKKENWFLNAAIFLVLCFVYSQTRNLKPNK